jgi:polysaccharide chain length determinant protein (PEP-CTERM system associated)
VVPGKKYAPEDYLEIIWRRKWLVIVPLLVSAVGTFLYSRTLPNVYRSQATVLIIPQQVPEKFIRPTVDEAITARLDLMRQQILSRARLERIIEEFDLYREERRTMLLDQVVEQMKRDINVTVQRVGRRQSPNHFVVSFDSRNPETAVRVAERLAALFVREHLEGRTIQTESTIQFLQRQADEKLRELQDHDRRLEAFKRANAGRLPGEVETNIQLMFNARQQIQNLTDGIDRDRERRLAVERLISEESAVVPLPVTRPLPADAPLRPMPAAQQLAAARAALDTLLLRLKEDHPDVRLARARIRDLEQKAEAEALQQPVSVAAGAAPVTPEEAERQKRIARLRNELNTLDNDVRDKQLALQRAQATLTDQERRVQAAPGLQSELADLMRGREAVQATYDGLLKKLEDAKLASSLEQQQVSQQLRIVDPARRPDRPRSPDRVRMNMIGALAGLGFGLLIAGILEYRDTSLRTDEDVLVALSLPVLALVPTMNTPKKVAPRRWRGLLLGSSAGAVVVLTLAAVAWKLGLFEIWGR